ncbi:hypothetical protein ACFL27_19795 [candidate division CSSED10-310 bacterium]|uniref:Uncharacterized protein n=1 Tax=candidate division CSSED10-310 bacterium TaxID=2855610 RepID=A0ABV6Z2B9_UNCC1
MIKESELLRRAVKWISDERRDNADAKTGALIDEAGKRFNLSPLQMNSLLRLLKDSETKE